MLRRHRVVHFDLVGSVDHLPILRARSRVGFYQLAQQVHGVDITLRRAADVRPERHLPLCSMLVRTVA